MFLNYFFWHYVKKTIHVNTSLPMDLCLTTSFMYIVQNEPILRCSPGLPNPMGRSIRTKSARQLRGFLWAVDGMWRLVLRPTSGRRRTNTLPAPWCRILLGRRPAVTLALPQWKWEGTYVDGHGITAHRTVLRPLLPKSCGHHGGDRGWLTNLGTTWPDRPSGRSCKARRSAARPVQTSESGDTRVE
jgi:hypothetical protein